MSAMPEQLDFPGHGPLPDQATETDGQQPVNGQDYDGAARRISYTPEAHDGQTATSSIEALKLLNAALRISGEAPDLPDLLARVAAPVAQLLYLDAIYLVSDLISDDGIQEVYCAHPDRVAPAWLDRLPDGPNTEIPVFYEQLMPAGKENSGMVSRVSLARLPLPEAGQVVVAARQIGAWTQMDRAVLETLWTLLNHTWATVQLRRQWEQEALTDSLTGLHNRRAFQIDLQRALSARQDCLVVMLDVDGLKQINDQMGHSHGDLLLKTVAEALRHGFEPQARTYRLGGDEYALLDIDGNFSEHELLRRFHKAMEFTQKAGFPGVRVSYGTARSAAHQTAEDLLSAADLSMYLHKRLDSRYSLRKRQAASETPEE